MQLKFCIFPKFHFCRSAVGRKSPFSMQLKIVCFAGPRWSKTQIWVIFSSQQKLLHLDKFQDLHVCGGQKVKFESNLRSNSNFCILAKFHVSQVRGGQKNSSVKFSTQLKLKICRGQMKIIPRFQEFESNLQANSNFYVCTNFKFCRSAVVKNSNFSQIINATQIAAFGQILCF